MITKQIRLLILLLIIVFFIAGYWFLNGLGYIDLINDTERFKNYILQLNYWGVLIIIASMAFAILFKFLPSAAVALTSGAVYGHTWGTIYIILGAFLGAIIAFLISRLLGGNILCRLIGKQIVVENKKSQSWLMWGLFISRLVPLIPFDIVSYAMGLTPLTLWRFSIATLIGLIPTSFILAHFGSQFTVINFNSLLFDMVIFSVMILVPTFSILIYIFRKAKPIIEISDCKNSQQ